MSNKIAGVLEECAAIQADRESVYGDLFHRHGDIVTRFFPSGVALSTPEEIARFRLFGSVVTKLSRYANNFKSGGHEDSLKDAINYIAMLSILDEDGKNVSY